MINQQGEQLIKESESLRLEEYLCPAGKWTIGWGHTKDVVEGVTISKARAQELFDEDVAVFENQIDQLLRVPANINQWSALVSLVFNIGIGNFRKSSVLTAHNRGDIPAAARAFNLWIKITDPKTKKKIDSNGLIARRAKEAALYLTAVSEADRTPTPQIVVPPTPPSRSGVTIGSAVTIGSGGIAVATQAVTVVKEAVDQSKSLIDVLQSAGPIVLGVISLTAIGYIVYRRFRRSKEGWL